MESVDKKNSHGVLMKWALTPSGNSTSHLVSDGKWIKSTFTAGGNLINHFCFAWMSHG